MKKLLNLLLSAMMLFAVGCGEAFDDSLIWDKLNSLENRVAALEQLCRQMNTNITSLQTVVEALQNNDYVTNIAPITEDGKVIGYTITFSKSGAITIYHGKDGKDGANGTNGSDGKDGQDGYTPVIGVAKDTDGVYYWTLDGDWLLDNDGNKIKAEGVDGTDGKNGEDGKDGKDGITPKLKIENGYWLISYDNGSTWQELGKATGEDGTDGDSMFKEVTYDDNFVYITLTDGSVLIIPRRKIAANEIWYTSTDSQIVKPYKTDAFGANILSNVYENGKGVITFDGAVTSIGVDAFYNCSSLTSVTIPDSVTSIGWHAFWGCSSLTSVTIPDSVTTIGGYAFSGCSSLEKFYGKFASADNRCLIIDGVLNSFAPAGLTSYTIPNSVTEIVRWVFYNCSSLTSITIPDSVTSIGEYAFSGCSSLEKFYGKFASEDNRCLIIDGVLNSFAPAGLTSYTIPNSVTKIAGYAFYDCSSLTSITIPDSVTEIGELAFYGCSSLTSVTIGNSVTSIGEKVFYNCSRLRSITIPDSVTWIGDSAFDGCSNLMSVTIPNNVTKIEKSAFRSCSSLTSITIPDSVTKIGQEAFWGCSSLTSITIPDSVTEIGYIAFYNCRSLTSVTIGNSVTKIGDGAFYNCSSLTSVYCQPTTPPTGGYDMFRYNASGRKIYVPTASVDAYKVAAGWKDYADDIVGYDF